MIYTRFADDSLVKAIERRDAFTRSCTRNGTHVSLMHRLLALFRPVDFTHQH